MSGLMKEVKKMEEAGEVRRKAVEKRQRELGADPQPETLVETIIRIANTPVFERRTPDSKDTAVPERRQRPAHT